MISPEKSGDSKDSVAACQDKLQPANHSSGRMIY